MTNTPQSEGSILSRLLRCSAASRRYLFCWRSEVASWYQTVPAQLLRLDHGPWESFPLVGPGRQKHQVKSELVVGSAEDLAIILAFTVPDVLPFYPIDTARWRDFAASISAIGFVVFLFWHVIFMG